MLFFLWTPSAHSSVFFFQAEDGIRDPLVTGVQTCALPISGHAALGPRAAWPGATRIAISGTIGGARAQFNGDGASGQGRSPDRRGDSLHGADRSRAGRVGSLARVCARRDRTAPA